VDALGRLRSLAIGALATVSGFLAGLWGAAASELPRPTPDWVARHPIETWAVLGAIARAFARTVRTGEQGVVFRLGRVQRVADAGLVWLVPGIDHLVSVAVRDTTFDLAPQRVGLADGVVVEARATLVVRVDDPAASVVAVSDLRPGVEVASALAVADVLRPRGRADLVDRSGLDADLHAAIAGRLAAWGVTVGSAAFTDLAPDARSARLVQLDALTRERAEAFRRLRAEAGPRLGLGLLGTAVVVRARGSRRR
jgi:regulator of protease activity HflC (stomatin/prohibitin superfamily)